MSIIIRIRISEIPENTFFGRETDRPRLFSLIINEYDRKARKGENGGLIYQAIAYGYARADRGHLDLIVDKVRTGSARQRRIGDVDGYYGPDLELSLEVKDFHISAENVNNHYGGFIENAIGNRVVGLAFAVSFDAGAEEILETAGVIPFSQNNLKSTIETWDWQKQDRAVHGILHYLSHVEQNQTQTQRMLKFIQEHDPSHSSLAYLTPDPALASDAQLDLSLEGVEIAVTAIL